MCQEVDIAADAELRARFVFESDPVPVSVVELCAQAEYSRLSEQARPGRVLPESVDVEVARMPLEGEVRVSDLIARNVFVKPEYAEDSGAAQLIARREIINDL